MRVWIVTLLLAFSAASANAASLSDYIPKSQPISGRVMQMAPSPEYVELANKVQAAAAKDQQWFLRYAKEHDYAKGHLPYHPKLGVTESEWKRVGELSGQMTMQQVGVVSFRVERGKDGIYIFKTTPEKFPLNNLSVTANQANAKTAYGRLDIKTDINQNNPNSITGRWSGIQWKHEEMLSETEGQRVMFAIGQRTDEGDGIIYYDVKNFLHGAREQYYLVILYPLEK